MYSDAVLSFPPVVTNMLSDPRTARFGPRLSSSKIFSQLRSPPPNKRRCYHKARYSWFFPTQFEPNLRTRPSLISLGLSLLKEKLSSKYCLYKTSQAGPLYWAGPANALFPHGTVAMWPSCRDLCSRNRGMPSHTNTTTMAVFMLETLKSS